MIFLRPLGASAASVFATSVFAASVFATSVLGACGGNDGGSQPATSGREVSATTTTQVPGTRLTAAQAARLSRVLFNNYDKGGADVEVTAPFGAATFVMKGTIDWRAHVGRLDVATSFTNGAAPERTEAYFTRSSVFSTLPGLTEAMAKQGRPGVNFVGRPLNDTSRLDLIIKLLDGLSSDRADNPLLIRQGEARYLRAEGGLDIYQYGPKTTYWVDAQGQMARLEARPKGFDGPVRIVLKSHRSVEVVFPPAAAVVGVAEIPDLYRQLTSPRDPSSRS